MEAEKSQTTKKIKKSGIEDMPVDGSTQERTKSSKKHKRKRDLVDHNTELTNDAPKEKKKKRSKDRPIEDTPTDNLTPSELTEGLTRSEIVDQPKEHKKKRKHKEDLPPDSTLSETGQESQKPDESSSEPKKKKSKKEKKDKKERVEHEPSARALEDTVPTIAQATPGEVKAFLESNTITIDSPHGEIIPALTFDHLGISPELRQIISEFSKPTPIQSCAWPALLAGHDVVGIAETGSGKTLAFGLPALAHLTSEKGKKAAKSFKGKGGDITVLVVAPTRELAIQTHETLEKAGAPFGIKSVCVYGGVDKGPQKKLLATPSLRIVVGTPGRLLDLANEGACDLSRVSYLVLDEADRMLDKGFEKDINDIIGKTSDMSSRQTLMFSATWPESVRRLANTFQRKPVRITVGRDELTANARVDQTVEVFDDPRSKDKRLHQLLKTLDHSTKSRKSNGDESRILIFVLYKKEADRVLDTIKYMGYEAGAIHGDMGQAQRMKALDEFKSGKTGLLIATDVAARGLDIPNVAAVINYSFPLTIEDYIHRIGRTGRGGKSGKSHTFFTGDKHERSLAGELARVLREGGFDAEPLKKFPMTLKKKEHSAYGAFFRDDIVMPDKPTKIKF